MFVIEQANVMVFTMSNKIMHVFKIYDRLVLQISE